MNKEKIILKPTRNTMISLVNNWGANSRVIVVYKNRTIELPLKRAIYIRNISCVYLLSQIDQLEQVMEVLRSQEGCPWDKEQTHESLLKYLIEEAYEYCDAVGSGQRNKMLEELGDLLLQVVFHCQIAKEENNFDLQQCAKAIKNKLIFRHPHIFKEGTASTAKEVEQIWKEQKKKEGSNGGNSLGGMPPAIRIEKNLQKFKNEYISEEMDKNTYKSVLTLIKSKENLLSNLGDLLVTIIVLGTLNGIDTTYELLKSIQVWEKTLKNS